MGRGTGNDQGYNTASIGNFNQDPVKKSEGGSETCFFQDRARSVTSSTPFRNVDCRESLSTDGRSAVV